MATATMEPRSTRKERWAWYLYDFGNSAYAAVVLLAVFSAYFKEEVVGGAEGTRLWGIAVFIAMFVVAVTSPFLGAIADFSGSKKRFLLFYTVMACLFTAALFFAQPGQVAISMAFFILAEIGYRSAQVFYNGLLTEIAEPEEMGRISGNGWAIGTAGGIICLLIILPLVVMIGRADLYLASGARPESLVAAWTQLLVRRHRAPAGHHPGGQPLQRIPQVHAGLPDLQ
jgi:UMF1 family MFS transporter